VKMMRSFVYSSPPSVSAMQNFSLQGFPITRKMWICNVVLDKPEDDGVREALFQTIEGMKGVDDREGGFEKAEMVRVEGECEF